jgi:hypothetical protein
MKKILLLILLSSHIFAISPYNLEGIKEVTLKISDKSKIISPKLKEKIIRDLQKELKNNTINVKNGNPTNLIIKIESIQIEKRLVLNISLFVNETVSPKRDKSLQGIGLTYFQNDMFEVEEELEKTLYDSIFKFLLQDFLTQHKEENL